jgi:hypothetical protein
MSRLKITLLLVLITVVSLSAALVSGNDDQGNPNDPFTNNRANACYEDGTMASKCDTEWDWICGWYMIRYDAGIFSSNDIPATCRVLLAGEVEIVIPETWPPAGCYYSPTYSLFIVWDGNQTQTLIDLTFDGSCNTPPHTGVGGFFFVSAADSTAARAICDARGYTFIDRVSSSFQTGAWPIYRCQI